MASVPIPSMVAAVMAMVRALVTDSGLTVATTRIMDRGLMVTAGQTAEHGIPPMRHITRTIARHITRTITRLTTLHTPGGAILRLALEFSGRMAGNAVADR